MIRISVTMLDSYLYWASSEDMSLDDLLARIRGTEEPTQQMLAGRAFHKVFEECTEGEIRVTQADGFEFEFACDKEIAVPSIRELKGEVLVQTPSGPVTLVGKVDALHGRTVIDYKLTERFDAERYTDSYQWRAYLMMFQASAFDYEVFQCKYDGPRVVVYDHHGMRFMPYPNMRADVERVVCDLAEIIAKYLPERVAA